ncbi:MAG: hypothetical protein HYZ39_16310 [Mycolicibacterium cosmeticum]|nr:hypothetical protein [Mycolicibacterium cosmeticum]
MAPPYVSPALKRLAFVLFNEGGVGGKLESERAKRLAVCSFIAWRTVESTNELSAADWAGIVKTLEYWKECGEIEFRCRQVATNQSLLAEVTAS